MNFPGICCFLVAAALDLLNSTAAAAAKQPELWFPVGERLTYRVCWGIFPVAETKVTTGWIEEECDEETRILLAIKVMTKSYALLDAIYPVDDYIESVVDPATFTPLRFVRRLSEGRYRLNEITTFNHKDKVAHWKHLVKKDERDFAITSDTRDLLSFMFFMRSQKFEPNKTYQYQVMADEKIYDLFVNAGNYQEINLPGLGSFRGLYVQPEAKFQGFFVRVGKLHVWISVDKRCLCLKALAKAPVMGTIKLYLSKVEGPGNDAWVKGPETGNRDRTNLTGNRGGTNEN